MKKESIIIRPEYGRLGNQIFQYSALKSLEAKVVLVGFQELFATFENVEARHVPKSSMAKTLRKWEAVRAKWNPNRLPWGEIYENAEDGTIQVSNEKKWVYVCKSDAFFQTWNEGYVDAGLHLQFRPEVLEAARKFRLQHGLARQNFLALHLRGGDYATFPSRDAPGQVPLDWVLYWSRHVEQKFPGIKKVILGDDAALKNEAAWRIGGVVSHESTAVDLALIASAKAGVISASSFAWWGAAFAHAWFRADGPFIAPRFWFGHGQGEWSPSSIRNSPHLTFAPVFSRRMATP